MKKNRIALTLAFFFFYLTSVSMAATRYVGFFCEAQNPLKLAPYESTLYMFTECRVDSGSSFFGGQKKALKNAHENAVQECKKWAQDYKIDEKLVTTRIFDADKDHPDYDNQCEGPKALSEMLVKRKFTKLPINSFRKSLNLPKEEAKIDVDSSDMNEEEFGPESFKTQVYLEAKVDDIDHQDPEDPPVLVTDPKGEEIDRWHVIDGRTYCANMSKNLGYRYLDKKRETIEFIQVKESETQVYYHILSSIGLEFYELGVGKNDFAGLGKYFAVDPAIKEGDRFFFFDKLIESKSEDGHITYGMDEVVKRTNFDCTAETRVQSSQSNSDN